MTHNSEMPQLKPCPFCGGAAHIEKFPSMLDQKWQADCSNPDCKASPCSNAWRTQQEALAAWNTRADLRPAWVEKVRGILADIARAAKTQEQPYCQDRAEEALSLLDTHAPEGDAESRTLRNLAVSQAEQIEALQQAVADLDREIPCDGRGYAVRKKHAATIEASRKAVKEGKQC